MSKLIGLLLKYDEEAELWESLTPLQYAEVIHNIMCYQRDGKPLPENPERDLVYTYKHWKNVIDHRLNGSKGGKTNYERNGSKYADNPGHFAYDNHTEPDPDAPF